MNKKIKSNIYNLIIIVLITLVIIAVCFFVPDYLLGKRETELSNKVYTVEVSVNNEADLRFIKKNDESAASDVEGEGGKAEQILKLIKTSEFQEIQEQAIGVLHYYSTDMSELDSIVSFETISKINIFLAGLSADLAKEDIDIGKYSFEKREGILIETPIEDRLIADFGTIQTNERYRIIYIIASEKYGVPLYISMSLPTERIRDIYDVIVDKYNDECGLEFDFNNMEYRVNGESVSLEVFSSCYSEMHPLQKGEQFEDSVSLYLRSKIYNVTMEIRITRLFEDIDEVSIIIR